MNDLKCCHIVSASVVLKDFGKPLMGSYHAKEQNLLAIYNLFKLYQNKNVSLGQNRYSKLDFLKYYILRFKICNTDASHNLNDKCTGKDPSWTICRKSG